MPSLTLERPPSLERGVAPAPTAVSWEAMTESLEDAMSSPDTPADIVVDDSYIGDAYGIVSDAGREAMMLLARTEGMILDPVYTSKAMAGLIGHARQGTIEKGATVVFVHTGGLPALFAYAQDLGVPPLSA